MPDRPAGKGLPLFALTVLAGGLVFGVASAAFPRAGQRSLPGLYPHPFSVVGAGLREAVVDPLGAGAWTFVLGWLAVGVALVRRRRRLTIAARIAGWALLTGCTCLLADRIGPDRLP